MTLNDSSKAVEGAGETAGEQPTKRVVGRPFKKGVSGNPKGRPLRSKNRLGEQFLDALQADFEKHGEKVIQKVRTTAPKDYLKVIASVLPKEIKVNNGSLGEMTDDELADILDSVRAIAIAGGVEALRRRTEEEEGSQQPIPLLPLPETD